MQSAFVDVGLERDTFLYVSDFLEEEHEDIDRVTGDERPPRESRENSRDRDRDRERDRRPAMRPPQEATPAISTPTAATSETSGSEADVPVAGTEAATTSPTQDRPADRPADRGGEDRDRRGRRSRRRRNRGRGFPESKYAEVGPAAAPVAGPIPVETEPAVAATPSPAETRMEIPLVLPGESLAKYRGGPQTAPVEHSSGRPASVPPPLPTPEELNAEEHNGEEIDVQIEQKVFEEPIHYPPENALPDAPTHSAPDGSLSSVGLASAEHILEPPPLPFLSEEAVSAQEAEDLEDAAQSGPITAPMLDEDEDLDIQAMILGEAAVREGDDEETVPADMEADLEGEPDAPAAGLAGEAGAAT